MRLLLLAALLCLAGPVTAAPQVAILVHHPYLDQDDPLGVPLDERDAFYSRHARFDVDQDGFDFPMFVADGVLPFEGLPGDPVKTQETYEALVEDRLAQPVPVAMRVASRIVEEARIRVWSEPSVPLDGEAMRLWVALAEDPVHYAPPRQISSGIEDHPFTVRAIKEIGPRDLTGDDVADVVLPLHPGWNTTGLWVVAWLQNGAVDTRFAAHEVVQAIMHPAAAEEISVQEGKGVLVEGYSATWCKPCFYGDKAIEGLARTYGVPIQREEAPDGYFVAPGSWVLVGLVAAGAALAAAMPRWRRP